MELEVKAGSKQVGGIWTTPLFFNALISTGNPYHARFKQILYNILGYKIWVRTTKNGNHIQEAKNVFKSHIHTQSLIAVYNGSKWTDIDGKQILNDLKNNYSFYYVYRNKDNEETLSQYKATIMNCDSNEKAPELDKNTPERLSITCTFPKLTVAKALENKVRVCPSDLKELKFTDTNPMVLPPS